MSKRKKIAMPARPKVKRSAKVKPKASAKARPAKRAGGKPAAKLERGLKSGWAFHPYADAFPMMDDATFKAFCARAKKNGYLASRPIVFFEGMILDGRNRARMCEATGLKPTTRVFDPKTEGDPLDFVISENLDRRHLTPSQRAMVAANLEKLARGRPRKGATGVTRDEAAERMNVSRRSVARGAVVRDKGSDELQQLVSAGAIAVKLAAEIAANLTPLEQAIVAKGGKDAVLNAAKKIRAEEAEKRRAERNAKIITNSDCTAESLLIGGRRYPLIFADPPVRYIMGDSDRSVENHYQTMSLDELIAFGETVKKLAADDAVLMMTMPDTHLFVTGLPILNAWGFEHKSGAVWDKLIIGKGKYFRMQHEHLLVCTRGKGLPEPIGAHKSPSIIRAKRGKHSEKPAELFAVIEKMYPQFFRKDGDPLAIELFARALKPNEKPRKGWAVWGNQAPVAEKAAA